MNVSYYYQLLDTGITYEKGRKDGTIWKVGEKRRLRIVTKFWRFILDSIIFKKQGVDNSDKIFSELELLCSRNKYPNYERFLENKEKIRKDDSEFVRIADEENKVILFMEELMNDLDYSLKVSKDKNNVYKILTYLHILPKTMHGRNVLYNNVNMVSYKDALRYIQSNMDDDMKKKYKLYFE